MKTFSIALIMLSFMACSGTSKPLSQQAEEILPDVEFSADSAYRFVAEQTAFGPRVPGSDSHSRCLDYLVGQMRRFGAVVTVQEGSGIGYDGKTVPIRNIIASYRPDRVNRVLLCSHWDSRPFADQDPDPAQRDKPISGANDGASGVGVLMEIGRQLKNRTPSIGVDIIFFDAEDGGLPSHRYKPEYLEAWCLGSTYWAQSSLGQEAEHRYGILLDMVGDANAVFPIEQYSKNLAPQVLDRVWRVAERKGFSNMFSRVDAGYITDDHVPVNRFTRVPMIDIIHLDRSSSVHGFCSTWHTQRDVVENISRTSLAAVGATLLTLIYTER